MPTARRTTVADGIHRPERIAVLVGIGLLLLALLACIIISLIVPKQVVPIKLPSGQGFVYFAAFYVAAQIVERITEPVSWLLDAWNVTDDKNKSNRTAVIHGFAILVAAVISSAFGLYFLQAVGIGNQDSHLPRWIDAFATALVISGGAKPLHDFISFLQQSKDDKNA